MFGFHTIDLYVLFVFEEFAHKCRDVGYLHDFNAFRDRTLSLAESGNVDFPES